MKWYFASWSFKHGTYIPGTEFFPFEPCSVSFDADDFCYAYAALTTALEVYTRGL